MSKRTILAIAAALLIVVCVDCSLRGWAGQGRHPKIAASSIQQLDPYKNCRKRRDESLRLVYDPLVVIGKGSFEGPNLTWQRKLGTPG